MLAGVIGDGGAMRQVVAFIFVVANLTKKSADVVVFSAFLH